MGTIEISVSSADIVYTDEYTEAGTSIGVVLEVVAGATANDSTLQFTTTEDAVINFSVVRLD